jgi:thiamine pyrophosphate-dependent acetolactate synthase large subunit-like protein
MVPGGGNADIAVTTMDVYGPESCTWVGGFGHSRIGISCALAAKLAQPKRPVVAIAGDGSSGLKGRRIVASEGVTT